MDKKELEIKKERAVSEAAIFYKEEIRLHEEGKKLEPNSKITEKEIVGKLAEWFYVKEPVFFGKREDTLRVLWELRKITLRNDYFWVRIALLALRKMVAKN
jgi:hypothetical protein